MNIFLCLDLLMIQLPFDSIDWVVQPIRGIGFLFSCEESFHFNR